MISNESELRFLSSRELSAIICNKLLMSYSSELKILAEIISLDDDDYSFFTSYAFILTCFYGVRSDWYFNFISAIFLS